MSDELFNSFGHERISDRQVDELIGIVRGITADDDLNDAEIAFLQKWLAGNVGISQHPVICTLYARIAEVLNDGIVDPDERRELMDALKQFSNRDFELGEVLKSTTLPLCKPAPTVTFIDRRFTFTGTFVYGNRKSCEAAVLAKGGSAGSLTTKTDFLVIGVYATDSWKHSSFGHKIMEACQFREKGHPIRIVSEEHWTDHL